MPILRSLIATPSTFASESPLGPNYMLKLSGKTFMAGLGSSGVKVSTDNGDTWGITSATPSVTGTLFALHSAAGAAAAGRIVSTPFLVSPLAEMYVSDNSGLTWATKTITGATVGTIDRLRGEKIIQTRGSLKRLIVKPQVSNAVTFISDDGGDTWAEATSPTAGTGTALEVRGSGLIEGSPGTATGVEHNRSADEDATSVSLPDIVVGSGVDPDEWTSGYHSDDNVIGLAGIRTVGAAQHMVFITVDGVGNAAVAFEHSTDEDIIKIDWVSPILGQAGKWAVSARTSTSKARWYISNDGDPTMFTLLHEQSTAVGSDEGILSNLVGFKV